MPSFRTQIIVLVSSITLIAALLLREFFISNLTSYQDQITDLATKEKVRDLYKEFNTLLDTSQTGGFNRDVEDIMRDLHKIEIAGDFYSRDIRRYSVGIVVLMVILTGSIFLGWFMIITRPLSRLLLATEQLKSGDFEFKIKESPFSPLNDLILAFNTMVSELQIGKD